jgi:hypothetical protein
MPAAGYHRIGLKIMYLFFVRHFNDIDHITPIAWKLKKDDYPVAVYCMNPMYEIHSDYRLQFLRSQGVAVKSLYETHDRQGDVIYRILHAVFQKCAEFQADPGNERRGQSGMPAKLMIQLAGRLRSMTFKLLRRWYYDASWAQDFLKLTGAQVLCFDHIMPKHYVVDALLKASCRLSLPSLALPHGVHLYTNDATKAKANDERRIAKFNRFDYVIVTNELRRSLLVRAGVEADKIIMLGSARYCSEWLELNNNILPGVFNGVATKTGQLKVVLMPSKPQCKMDVDRLYNTCRILAGLEGVEAMIKPHTRTHSRKYGFDKNPLPDVSNVLTAELCEWADVILNVGSSVITEALMRDKPALYLKYLHTNITRFEEIGACWTIHDETELKRAMSTLQADKNYMPYSQENVAAFLSEIVYGGNPNRDVLAAYAQFIVDCANPKQTDAAVHPFS